MTADSVAPRRQDLPSAARSGLQIQKSRHIIAPWNFVKVVHRLLRCTEKDFSLASEFVAHGAGENGNGRVWLN